MTHWFAGLTLATSVLSAALIGAAPAVSPTTSAVDRVVISGQTETQVVGRFIEVDASAVRQSKHRHAVEHLEPDPAHSIFDRGAANPLQRTTTVASAQPPRQRSSGAAAILVAGGSKRHVGEVQQQQRGRRSAATVTDREYDVLVSDFSEDEPPVQVVAADDPKATTQPKSAASIRVVGEAEVQNPRAIEAPIHIHRIHVPAHLLERQSEEADEDQNSTSTASTSTTTRGGTTKSTTPRRPSATAPPPVEFSGQEPESEEIADISVTSEPSTLRSKSPTFLPVQKAERVVATSLSELARTTTVISTHEATSSEESEVVENATSTTIKPTQRPTRTVTLSKSTESGLKVRKLKTHALVKESAETQRDASVESTTVEVDRVDESTGLSSIRPTVTIRSINRPKPRLPTSNYVSQLRRSAGFSRRRRETNPESIQPPTTPEGESVEFEEVDRTPDSTTAATTAGSKPVVDLDEWKTDVITDTSRTSTTSTSGLPTQEATTTESSASGRSRLVPSVLLTKVEDADTELRDIAPPDSAVGATAEKPATSRIMFNGQVGLTSRPQRPAGDPRPQFVDNDSNPSRAVRLPAFPPQFSAQAPPFNGPMPTLNHFIVGNRRIIVPSISYEQHVAQQFGGFPQFVPPQPVFQPAPPQFAPRPPPLIPPPPSISADQSAPAFDSSAQRRPPPPPPVFDQPTTPDVSLQRTTASTLADLIRTPAPVVKSHVHDMNLDLYDEVGANAGTIEAKP